MANFDREAMLEMFICEMMQLIEQLESNTIQNDECYSKETINEIFRIMHTIKGSASMMLFTNISVTAHAIEDLFFYLRENNTENVDYSKVTDLVLEVVDFIKKELEKIESKEDLDESYEFLTNKIKDFVKEIKNNENSNKITTTKSKENNKDNDLINYFAKIFFEENSGMENVRAYNIIRNLEKVSSNIISIPENVLEEKALDIICKDGIIIKFCTNYDYDYIKNIIKKVACVKKLDLKNNLDKSNNFIEKKELNNYYEYDIEVYFEEDSEMENIRAYALINNLKDIAIKINYKPEDLFKDEALEKIKNDGFKINVITIKTYGEIEEILSKTIYMKDLVIIEKNNENNENKENIDKYEDTIKNKEININNKNNLKEQDESKKDKNNLQKAKKNSTQVINVSIQKLDQLLNLVGELVISEAMVTQNPDLEGLELDSFTKETRQLHKIIKDIQDTVMSMRMIPLSTTFFKMHRIVRDMCRQLKKEVQLEVIGEETEVDKNIIDHISDPLMHIIRNSIDHGIEMPDIRKKLGKEQKGTVILEAKNSGGDVLIIIRDDGAGFNKNKIIAKAKKQGLLTKQENEYTDKEIFQFIFLPGFSTNEEVTSFSGRGVGMDVVATNIEIVGGSVVADSIEGEGTVFTLKIPLTLAIIEGMLINVGNSKFTIPIVSIKRSFKASQKDIIIDPNGNEMILVRGKCYNLLRIKQYFKIEGKDNIEEGIILMLENENETICVFADELIGEQQVVVKNMPKYIKKIKGISGCTLLGNGDISLIIDISSFFYK